jgi:hypothetical protein
MSQVQNTFTGTIETQNIHQNTAQNVIIITEDKTRIVLEKYRASVVAKNSWVTPFSLTITLIVTLATAAFTPKFGLTAEYIEAIFTVSTAACTFWTIANLRRLWSVVSLDQTIQEMKSDSGR